MPIFQIDNNSIQPIASATFPDLRLLERQNLQRLLKSRIDVISPDTLLVAEEFSEWEDSNRSIDLLGIDKEANLVVIELKRTSDGGHAELQAIRYAAMIAKLTFEKLVTIFGDYLRKNDIDEDPADLLLNFLGDKPDEDKFGQEVRIVLASGGFSKELTTSVLWLNEFDLDIRCVRMQPYDNSGQILLDVQTIIPMPETEDYQVRIQEKRRKERASRKTKAKKYDVEIAGNSYTALNMRATMFNLVSGVLENGITPQQIDETIPVRVSLFVESDGKLNAEQMRKEIMKLDRGQKVPKADRYFCKDDSELFYSDNKTYALSNDWWEERTEKVAKSLIEAFPNLNIHFRPAGA